MYGMVNKAVKELVSSQFGEPTWLKIAEEADSPRDFVAFDSYDDDVTYRLVGAVSNALDMEGAEVLRVFGNYWIKNIATVQFAELMNKTGSNFVSFVENLDHMHSRIRVSFPNYQPPSFRVKVLEDELIQVDYYSEREGLMPFVEGLFAGLGEHFQVSIEIEHIPDDHHPMPCKRMKVKVTESRD